MVHDIIDVPDNIRSKKALAPRHVNFCSQRFNLLASGAVLHSMSSSLAHEILSEG